MSLKQSPGRKKVLPVKRKSHDSYFMVITMNNLRLNVSLKQGGFYKKKSDY